VRLQKPVKFVVRIHAGEPTPGTDALASKILGMALNIESMPTKRKHN